MQDLPAVPTIEVTLPSNYPSQVEYLIFQLILAKEILQMEEVLVGT